VNARRLGDRGQRLVLLDNEAGAAGMAGETDAFMAEGTLGHRRAPEVGRRPNSPRSRTAGSDAEKALVLGSVGSTPSSGDGASARNRSTRSPSETCRGHRAPPAHRNVPDLAAMVGAALAPVLAALVRDAVREELRHAGDADPWVPHPRWPCASRRAACTLARSGAIEGVRRVGQGRGALYLVRQSALDAWIEAQTVDAAGGDHDDEYEREMGRRGLVSSAPRPARGRR
jgi:hypothetical protein